MATNVSSTLKNARISPQKCRIVADEIRGKPVGVAVELLTFSTKKAAQILRKLLVSAVANAEHNEGADIDDLRVAKVVVDEGPTLKRVAARAKGRANRIVRRTSHVTITVSE